MLLSPLTEHLLCAKYFPQALAAAVSEQDRQKNLPFQVLTLLHPLVLSSLLFFRFFRDSVLGSLIPACYPPSFIPVSLILYFVSPERH